MTEKMLKSKIKKKTIKQGTCLIWQGYIDQQGFPMVYIGKRKHQHLTRVIWRLNNKPMPQKGQYILHKLFCNNRLCINPNHLFLGGEKDKHKIARVNGRIFHTYPDRWGEKHWNNILTKIQVIAILKNRKGLSQEELGKKYGCCRGNISAIQRRFSWKWLEYERKIFYERY